MMAFTTASPAGVVLSMIAGAMIPQAYQRAVQVSHDRIDLVVTSNSMMNFMGRNSKMLSIGTFAKTAKVSSRTIRYALSQ